jgi:hypothetical protein
MKYFLLTFFFGVISIHTYAQDDLMNMLENESKDSTTTEYTTATFKSMRVINGQSVETVGKGVLSFVISHRFGPFNSGAYNFFGLDQATIRLGFEYGITDRLELGCGRNSLNKVYDGYVKYKLLRQSKGARSMPITVTWFSSVAVQTIKLTDTSITDDFNNRLYYTHQLLIARKFSKNFSMQVSPTLIHRNLVDYKDIKNDLWAIGISGRYKLTKRLSLNAEYFYLLPDQTYYKVGTDKINYANSFSIGFDIETGGHVFQLHCTNSMGMIEKAFVGETTGRWDKGDIMFGFNVTRPFNIAKGKRKDKKSE